MYTALENTSKHSLILPETMACCGDGTDGNCDGERRPLLSSRGRTGDNSRVSQAVKQRVIMVIVSVLYLFSLDTVGIAITLYVHDVMRDEHNMTRTGHTGNTSICAHDTRNGSAYQKEQEVQKEAALWLLYYLLALGIPAFFATTVLGSYSDKVGRRWLFFFPTAGLLLRSATFSAVSYWNLPLYILAVVHTIEGCSGFFIMFFVACFAYTSDITITGMSRNFHVTAVEVMFGLLGAASRVTVGYLIEYVSYTVPALLSTALLLVNILIILFFLPETRPEPTSDSPNRRSILSHIQRTFKFYYERTPDNCRQVYLLCAGILACFVFVYIGKGSVETLFLLNEPFCWDSVKIGNFGAITAVIQCLVTIVFVGVCQVWLSDSAMGSISVSMAVISFTIQGFASTDLVYYIGYGVRIFAAAASAMLRSIMSKLSSPHEQGAVYASMGSIEVLALLCGGATLNAIYQATLTIYRGIVFFICAEVMALSMGVFIGLHILLKAYTRAYGLRSVVDGDQPHARRRRIAEDIEVPDSPYLRIRSINNGQFHSDDEHGISHRPVVS